MGGRLKDKPLNTNRNLSHLQSRIAIAITIGILLGCIFAFLFPHKFLPTLEESQDNLQMDSYSHETSEEIKMLKLELQSLSEKNMEQKKHINELQNKLRFSYQTQKRFPLLGKLNKSEHFDSITEQRTNPNFVTVDEQRTNPKFVPVESANPRLAKILAEVAIQKELIVTIANSRVKEMLKIWFTTIKKVGIPNFLVIALDDETENFCKSNEVPVYRTYPDAKNDETAKNGFAYAVSGLKFRILMEFLKLGYSVLVSDVDVVYLQNPFHYLYRDSDVESMSDGHDNKTAYGYHEGFGDFSMGYSGVVDTIRIWVYNSGFFYIRPTFSSMELLKRVSDRISQKESWDQVIFNDELFMPSYPGYKGNNVAKRTMDFYLFMNSKVLFMTVRNDTKLRKFKPVIIHLNYHRDKLQRMKAVVEFYINGNQDALKPFEVGS